MGVSFRATGLLSDLLREFKNRYLVQLTEEDLSKRVTLSVQECTEDSEEDAQWLKEKLVEVIENE
mgnify:CR=1 FL=1